MGAYSPGDAGALSWTCWSRLGLLLSQPPRSDCHLHSGGNPTDRAGLPEPHGSTSILVATHTSLPSGRQISRCSRVSACYNSGPWLKRSAFRPPPSCTKSGAIRLCRVGVMPCTPLARFKVRHVTRALRLQPTSHECKFVPVPARAESEAPCRCHAPATHGRVASRTHMSLPLYSKSFTRRGLSQCRRGPGAPRI